MTTEAAHPARRRGESAGGHEVGAKSPSDVEPHDAIAGDHTTTPAAGRRLAVLSLTALGVVYGDIGTSPLYAIRQCFDPAYGLVPSPLNVYGILSLVLWALILIVSVKYIVFIMRADNHGEGGILALLALLLRRERRTTDSRRRLVLISLGLFGAALLYGDGIITPAISVLGAVEGMEVVTPTLKPFVVILSLAILFGLFMVQRLGTAKVGSAFGPVMALWFTVIGVLGAMEVARAPHILSAVNPWYAVTFFRSHGRGGFLILGAVVLAVTGAEALYADMGHFGKRPIRLAWFVLVLPALLLNYFGQGAVLLRNPAAAANPFFLLAPRAFLWPLVIIATAAAVVASQALISGAFSLTQQSVQLGYSPRVTIIHTSEEEAGQIFIPEINKILMVGCLALVLAFRGSNALGAAYGIAVTGTMAITSVLFYVVARSNWNWSALHAGAIAVVFLVIDLAFFAANVVKFTSGGWVPVAIAVVVYTLMSSWKTGRDTLHQLLHSRAMPLDLFLADVARRKTLRVTGTAIFMTSSSNGVPIVLLLHLKHNKVLHEEVILMSVNTQGVPRIDPERRATVEVLGQGFYRVIAQYGFMEVPDMEALLARIRRTGIHANPMETTFYISRERVVAAHDLPRLRHAVTGTATPTPAVLADPTRPTDRMARWRTGLFVVMLRNARSATEFFGIPPNQVVELGTQVEL